MSRPQWGPTEVQGERHGCLRALNAIPCLKEPGLLGKASSRPGQKTWKMNRNSGVQLKSGRRPKPLDSR